jgi:type IV secretory pathway VirB9-like protein
MQFYADGKTVYLHRISGIEIPAQYMKVLRTGESQPRRGFYALRRGLQSPAVLNGEIR